MRLRVPIGAVTPLQLSAVANKHNTQYPSNATQGGDAGNGGHIYTAGVVYAEDACGFTYGTATGNVSETRINSTEWSTLTS